VTKADAILSACSALASNDIVAAGRVLDADYPFKSIEPSTRKYTQIQSVGVFMRDGFIDRYSGSRLVFPGVLRLLSILLPQKFPYHRNWKVSETHPAYWDLSPTIDHLVPVTLGGRDDDENLITTSMLMNAVKAHWSLEQLGWELHPPGDIDEWDGLVELLDCYGVYRHRIPRLRKAAFRERRICTFPCGPAIPVSVRYTNPCSDRRYPPRPGRSDFEFDLA
jgi:hypothetical protein